MGMTTSPPVTDTNAAAAVAVMAGIVIRVLSAIVKPGTIIVSERSLNRAMNAGKDVSSGVDSDSVTIRSTMLI